MNLKGTFPMLILQILSEGPLHGYAIARALEDRTSGILSLGEGSLYPTLHTQENHGFVESYERVENGRRRRYYRLTKKGGRALEGERQEWDRLSAAINMVLEGTS